MLTTFLRQQDENGLDGVSEVISLLKQSSCLGNHDASFMLATIINYGLFIEVDLKQVSCMRILDQR